MKSRLVVVGVSLSALLTLAGCATTGQQALAPIETTKTYAASFDKVWGAIVSELSASYPVQTVDKSSGLITTQLVSLGSGFAGWNALKQYAYEPRSLLATWQGGARCRLTIYATKVDATNTKVRITAHFEGFDPNWSHSWQVWESRGVLEAELFGKIGAAL